VFALPLSPDAELRRLEVWHAAEFAEHMERARTHIRPWVGPAFVTDTVDDARAVIERYAKAAAADGARLFGIWMNEQLVGGVMFVTFSTASGTCEMGCWLEPSAEGQGLVTTACHRLLEWAFAKRGLHRVEWRCRTDNERSVAMAKRLGMTLEGVAREAWPNGGIRHDKQMWAILAPEWAAAQVPADPGHRKLPPCSPERPAQ